MNKKDCIWYVFWSDEDWPSDGVIEVVANSPTEAKRVAIHLMTQNALRGEGPKHWRFEYEPTDTKPNWIK
jgi:hypothetical protein